MGAPTPIVLEAPAPAERLGRARRRAVPIVVCVAAVVLLGIGILVVFGPWIAPQDPLKQDLFNAGSGPGNGHPLGTDSLGRDVLSLSIAGARAAVVGPVLIAAGAALIGAITGLYAAWRGGIFDATASRIADLMYALPGLLVVIVVVGVLGQGYWLGVTVLLVLSIPTSFRLTRSAATAQVRLPYVEVARTLGLPARRILFRHLLPNVTPTILATFLLDFVGALIGLAALAYLGLGTPPGTPDWGSLLADGQTLLNANRWLSIAPAVLIVLTSGSVTILGDWLYDRYTQDGPA